MVDVERAATEALPDEIAGLKSTDPVADREQNQRGAGFTRVYREDDAENGFVATVFVYNNRNFGVDEEITPAVESLMEKHLQEMQALKDSGLYADVKTETPKVRTFRWGGVNYQVIEADVRFTTRDDEEKQSLIVLGANSELMSFIRIRYTYPRSKQARARSKTTVFTRSVFHAAHKFAQAQKTPDVP
ncbi:MAG TPA: hypothetical protein DCX19_00620 [Alphaproteobacteria bacterium]|nr:hypothetical protein [Alphaproteobacteria bacterium]